jgi:hypothetical protein
MALYMPQLPPRPTRAMVALAAINPQRAPVLRPGRTVTTNRPTNLEAYYGQYTGQVNASGCTHCAGGSGPWTLCVSVAGHFRGSCANCHYGTEGAPCSLRKYNPDQTATHGHARIYQGQLTDRDGANGL